ncbi:MAG: glycosyltransferase [Lactobacillaceae bacterium]|nr:glycosyltransferase [Lactobacillaceae bacterium]
MELSVSIVAYKNYTSIEKAIKTLEQYTPSTISKKIYILDNGNTPDIKYQNIEFKQFIKKYNDIVYIDLGKNIGFGKAHNKILSIINSKYHCIMNPDIVFKEDVFSSILRYMDLHTGVGMVIPNIVDNNGRRQLAYRNELTIFDMFTRRFCKSLFPKRFKSQTLQYKDYSKPFQVPFGQGSFLVIKSSLYKKLNGFDENFFMYMEDADLCKRVNEISKLMYYPYVSVVHKWEKGSHKNLKLFKIHVASAIIYFRKWGIKLF